MNMREAADALRMSNVEATLRAAQAARRSHAVAAPYSQRLPNTEALLSMPTTRGPRVPYSSLPSPASLVETTDLPL